jgi:chitinase
VRSWEKFTVHKVGGGAIHDGDTIGFSTMVKGLYVSAENGGGGAVDATRTWMRDWEEFVLGSPGASGGPPPPPPVTGGGATEYAPYFYTWGWGAGGYAFSSLAEMKSKGGPAAVTLAFVLSDGSCRTSRDIQDHLDDVRAYAAAGGHVKASFGGADGTYLEYACGSAGELASAIEAFIDETGITDLDFDLEQGSRSSNAGLNALRAAALKQVQDARHARVAFTLPVAQSGILQESVDIVAAAVQAGVQISFVNGMTMDYGDGTDLGVAPSQSMDSLARQLQSLLGLGEADAYRKVGAIAMLGKNDDNETFSLDNARTFIAHAKQKQLGLVSFWAIQRDQRCPGGLDLNYCNGQNGGTFDFHQIFDGATH